jgi:CMP-N,N'-diacetyllegionaminic acid synthase
MNAIAIVPVSLNSKQLKNKDIYNFAGHPLFAYSIRSAVESKIFSEIICLTDNFIYGQLGKYYGADQSVLYPQSFFSEDQSNREWLSWLLRHLQEQDFAFDTIAILGPNNPFNLPEVIERAWNQFQSDPEKRPVQSMDELIYPQELVWKISINELPVSLSDDGENHSGIKKTDQCIKILLRNSAIEIYQKKNNFDLNSQENNSIQPFLTKDYEGFRIRNYKDVIIGEHLISIGKKITQINLKSYLMDNI